jgi:hypothetical protein
MATNIKEEQTPTPTREGVVGRTRPDFLENCVGMFANNPAFEKMTEAIEAERNKEREEANQAFDKNLG